MKTVKFIDVGRNKLSWTAQTAEISLAWLTLQVAHNGGHNSLNLALKNVHGKGDIYDGAKIIEHFEIVTETVTNEGGGTA